MLEQKKLVRQVKAKNRISNIALCFKIALDLIPQALIIHLIASAFSGRLSLRLIAFDAGAMLACFVLKAACGYLAVWKAHEAAYNALTDLRMRIIEHLKKLHLGFFQERKTGDLTNIVEHDVEQVEVYLAHGLPEIMAALLLPALIFAVMLFIEWRLALLMIAGIPLMGFVQLVSAPQWKKNFKIFAQSTKEMQENLMEYVANISVIKAFGKEERKTEKTIRSAKDYVYWVKKSMMGISVPMGLIDLFMESGVVLVMIFGIWLSASGSLSAARFILCVILGAAFTSSVAKTATFQHYGVVFNQAMAGIGSILNVVPLEKKSASDAHVKFPAAEKKNPATSEMNTVPGASVPNGDIEINAVDFSYKGTQKTLKHICLTFKKGSKNALVGSSGCGKTTLANLLMGFWQPDSGSIRIGGMDMQSLSDKQVNSLFSIVQQETFLFNLSIEENIRIGKPGASKDEIIEAAKKARIHDFIMSLSDGYLTRIGENGAGLSGGQKQRISIARAFLKDSPILLLDEMTSNVDPVNEALIQEAISELAAHRTVLVIAHHLSTIRSADRILVFKNGEIIQAGIHDALLADTNGSYYRLWSQGINHRTVSLP